MAGSNSDLEARALDILDEALELLPDDREAFARTACADDERLLSRVLELLSEAQDAPELLATGGAQTGSETVKMPDRVGAYRIEELIGQGGMGAVFRGSRDTGDFDHQVAIKLIRSGTLSDAMIERFERERQILASLTHPHIARLYDGGTAEDGEPFIVMEYIEGTPISKWVEEQELTLDQRLELFEQVSSAVGFAHQNLIIHRDLTPSNVLVTPEGEPKLIDFGIAKPHQDELQNDTAKGSLSGLSLTPGFAAPERVLGAPATTLTDIYSLGKLLEILTKKRSNNADLTAVIGRASEQDPDARYRSCDALIDDLQRLRDGRAVAARDGGQSYILRKFLVRRRYAVAAVAAIILLLVGGLVATAIGFQQARVAQAEAETRFGEVRELANTLLFDVYDAVDEVPGSTAARQLLAETAQGYLDALTSNANAPVGVRLEAGLGYMRLAHVMGGVGGGTLGLRDEALANYQRADDILTALYESDPDNRAVVLALAELRYHRSVTMVHIAENLPQGIELARGAREILDAHCGEAPECTLLRAQTYNAEGQNLYWSEELLESVTAFDTSITLLQSLDETNRQTETVVRAESLAHRSKGDALYYLDDLPGSVREFDVAVGLLRAAMERGMDNPDMQRDLAIVQWTRGGSLDEMDEEDEAIAALDEAYAIMEGLSAADPDDAGSLRLVAIIGGQRGLTLSSAGRFPEAIAAAEASLAIRERLSDEQSEEPGFFRDVAIQLNGLGDIHQRAGNRAEACRYFTRTINQFDALDRRWGMTDFDRNDTYARASEAIAGC